jgi:hypothetical protein
MGDICPVKEHMVVVGAAVDVYHQVARYRYTKTGER